ncbi:cobyric acid synthase [Rhodoferax antarcticus]|uniref:cobyric acid synthase n=1 Tax=Rhodoferax antarcticus TaxID=81479 RepID=UPI002224DDFA|nr:cobyric acid synthase [Rhodoferax antarcticus]MCW2310315.1 adenosylcobyric acid synthase [Rhodoferax antarcticus]
MTATCIMVLGTTSGAGKSWLATALCRYYARQGLKVVPFKAQNMSNNARVVASSNGQGEIGSAQYFQALAAKALPDVRMNPLLLKPEADTHSQVVLMGEVSAELTAMPWRGRSVHVWPQIAAALDELRAENDVVVIEGAGSPAEINLSSSDIVNMRVALHCNAACLLVTDIDRGGAFAHLYGTWALLPAPERALIKGFVLNKFRGDAALLAPAPQMLQDLTGIPTVATLPMWWQHGLPEEDGVFDMAPTFGTGVSSLPPGGAPASSGGRAPLSDCSTTRGEVQLTVAVVAYPRISNLDEFQPLKNIPGVRLMWVRSPAELAGLSPCDWVVLPGSKSTTADLAWLRSQGLDAAVARHAAQGGAVLGVCGGLQMLGEALVDTHGVDGNAPGLGLLPLVTLFLPDKTVRHTQTRFVEDMGAEVMDGLPSDPLAHSPAVEGQAEGLNLSKAHKFAPGLTANSRGQWSAQCHNPWSALAGVQVSGYEIHHGQTAQHPAMAQAGDVARAVLPGGLGWQNGAGNVLGIYLHGLFEDPAAPQALFASRLDGPVPTLDAVFERMADFIATHFEPGVLQALLKP